MFYCLLGKEKKSKWKHPQLYDLVTKSLWVFLLNHVMKESLEKCLQISLMMLYNCFEETGMRLLVVMEKSFH